jgi:hypothetical protein
LLFGPPIYYYTPYILPNKNNFEAPDFLGPVLQHWPRTGPAFYFLNLKAKVIFLVVNKQTTNQKYKNNNLFLTNS